MIKQKNEKKVINFRLHIAFILTLTTLIFIFYFSQKFNQYTKIKKTPKIPTIELIEIPITFQKRIVHQQLLNSNIPIQSDKNEIRDSIQVSIENDTIHDSYTVDYSTILFYVSSLFPELYEIPDFDPGPIIDASKKTYDFKNYFAYRLSLPDTGKPHEPSSPLVDEALRGSMGRPEQMISISLIEIPLTFPSVKIRKKQQLTFENLLTIKEHFSLLEYIYQKPAISLVELYKIRSVSDSYTFSNLSNAINMLCQEGLVLVRIDQAIKLYTASFTIPEMIEQINRMLTTISKEDEQNREFLYKLVHQLITWS